MILLFEKIENPVHLNFIDCPDLNSSGIRRFTPCPIALAMMIARLNPLIRETDFVRTLQIVDNMPNNSKFVIPSGVAHSPEIWCGNTEKYNVPTTNKSLFYWLSDAYLTALRNKKAFLLLDQSHEGYQTLWLWDWFHDNCKEYNIDPTQIIYVTGNLDCSDQYAIWCKNNNPPSKMLVIPYAHFEGVISTTAQNYHNKNIPMKRILDKLPSFDDQITYKKTHNIKTFNILQKRVRNHRIWLFKILHDHNLIQDNIVSMNEFSQIQSYLEGTCISDMDEQVLSKLTPMMPPQNPDRGELTDFISSDCGDYLTALNEQIMLDTWCSVISEASFSDIENTCFISEKTFKPMACNHPFIIFGNKGSLKRLQEMGYRTFHPFIDETYDKLSTWDRMDAIAKEMVRISCMSDEEKLIWYTSMKDILEHNSKILIGSKTEIHKAFVKIEEHIKNV